MKNKAFLALVALIGLGFILTACSGSVAGYYKGDTGRTTMTINKDNTLEYTQEGRYTGETKHHNGTWKKKGDHLYFTIEDINHGDELMANIEKSGNFYIPSTGTWNAESFTKSK